eukprot:5453423-Alexandrium_andersonii.AAC.1
MALRPWSTQPHSGHSHLAWGLASTPPQVRLRRLAPGGGGGGGGASAPCSSWPTIMPPAACADR